MNVILKSLVRELLVFSVAVVLLATGSFLCGGHCAAWQWYLAVAFAMFSGCKGCGRRNWFLSNGLFLLSLLILLALTHTLITNSWLDANTYHMPATRMLEAGWNPVCDSTPERIATIAGSRAEDARFLMIMAMPKTAWIFNAVAAKFTGDLANLFFPLFFVLALATSLHVWIAFRENGLWVRVLAVLVLLSLIPSFNMPVDVAVALGGIGLLVSMWRILRGDEPDWIALFSFSFWLSASKQTGALQCFAMWIVFACVAIRTWMSFRRYALLGVLLMSAWACASVSPFYTTWRHYGHPLYPCYSVDEKKFPIQDVVGDFKVQNADAASMSYLGRFVNGYVSSEMTKFYYRVTTGRKDFTPHALYYTYGNPVQNPTSPSRDVEKLAFSLFFIIVVAMGRKQERFAYLIGLIAMFTVPKLMVGYLRYVPWALWSGLLVLAIADQHFRRWVRFPFLCLLACAALAVLSYSALKLAILVDQRYTMEMALTNHDIPFAAPLPKHDSTTAAGILAAHAYGIEKFEREPDCELKDFYTYEFCVPAMVPESYYQVIMKETNRKERVLKYPQLMLRAIPEFITLLFRRAS